MKDEQYFPLTDETMGPKVLKPPSKPRRDEP